MSAENKPAAESGKRVRIVHWVEILEAKPNKMFTEAHRALVRFLRYNVSIKCAECGKRRRVLWTMLCSFQALDMGMLIPKRSGVVHNPLTPVCQSHLLAPEVGEVKDEVEP